MPQAVVYVRVSSDEQVKGMSLDFQKADCLAYAEKRGLTVERIFEERGESAKFANRPKLMMLLEHCRKRRSHCDAMIVWKLDRLSRNQLDYYYLKRTLLEDGVAIHSATEPSVDDATSISGKVFETFSALQAEIDNTVRSERTRRGMDAKFKAGIYPFRAPVGYLCRHDKRRGEKKSRPDDPDPVAFPIIQSVLRQYARGGFSQLDLARMLDERGLAAARGRKTHGQLVTRFLHAYLDFYAGYLTNPWTGERLRGAHQAMLTEEEALRVAAIRDGRSVGAAVKKLKVNPLFPLRRTVRCAACGVFLTASVSRGNGGCFAYYHCRTPGCAAYGKSVRKRDLEDAFAQLAAGHTLKTRFLLALRETLEQALGQAGLDATTARELRAKRIEELERKKRRIFEMREDGAYTQAEFMERKRVVEGEMDALKLEVLDQESEVADLDALFAQVVRFTEDMGSEWAVMPLELQQRFQQLLFPEGISYDPKSGFGTAILGPIFGLNSQFEEGKSPMVPRRGVSWNQILADLRQMAKI